MALVIAQALLLDLRSGAALEIASRSTVRVAANFLVWADVAAALRLEHLETSPTLAAAFGHDDLVDAAIDDLPIVEPASFPADCEPLHGALAHLLKPAVEHVTSDRVYALLCGAPATCARRSAALRQIVITWHAWRPLGGFYQSHYGAHGVELLYFWLDGWRLRALKLTGDPNVPAGEVSVDVNICLSGRTGCGRVRLAGHGFSNPYWGVLLLRAVTATQLRFEWQARDDFLFSRCDAETARALYDAALPPERWLAGTHRLARERMPAEARAALFS